MSTLDTAIQYIVDFGYCTTIYIDVSIWTSRPINCSPFWRRRLYCSSLSDIVRFTGSLGFLIYIICKVLFEIKFEMYAEKHFLDYSFVRSADITICSFSFLSLYRLSSLFVPLGSNGTLVVYHLLSSSF
jgi:hypothetical protein